MIGPNNATYTPYGAYEMKARYQNNFLFATGSAVGLVLAILITVWVIKLIQGSEEIFMAPTVIKTIADLGPPPTIVQKPPQVQVTQPNVAIPKVGIPTPVAEEDAPADDVVLATKDELADIVPPDIASSGDGDIKVDINEEDYIPAPGEFQALEQNPEIIKEVAAEYPRFAKDAGLEGKVVVWGLVDKDGNIIQTKIARPSGTPSLDEAAEKALMLFKLKPGIQNGRPVKCWISKLFSFEID